MTQFMGEIDPEDLDTAEPEFALFADCKTPEEARTVLCDQVETETAILLELVRNADAFDVIELIKLREFPPYSDAMTTATGGSPLVVEIIAAVLLSRDSRQPSQVPREDTRPHEVIDELHQRAKRLGRLAIFKYQVERSIDLRPIAQISADYQAAILHIRNYQYSHIREEQEQRLFRHSTVEKLMSNRLGYTYDEVVLVREALKQISSRRLADLINRVADLIEQRQDKTAGQLPTEFDAELRDAMIAMLFLPGDRATIHVSTLEDMLNLEQKHILNILNSYSQSFDSSVPASARVLNILNNNNPFLTTPLVADGAGGFVSTVNEPGLDSLRRVVEKSLVDHQADMRRYDQKVRQPMSEVLGIEALERILRMSATYVSLHYFAPKNGEAIESLNQGCSKVAAVGDRVETDALFIVDDVAIIVEVKAKSVTIQSKRGDTRRLQRDLETTIGSANKQIARLQELIEVNGGIWLTADEWLDLAHVREIRSVVVMLDDLGPIGVSIGSLQDADLLSPIRPPWVVSLHDLKVVSEICATPGEFLLYLRRRTDSGVTRVYRGSDELDLYMLFLEGDLYVEESKNEETDLPKRSGNTTAGGIEQILVADRCAPLDEWYLQQELSDEPHELKPAFSIAPEILPVIDAISTQRMSGWLRCTTDLLGLAGKTQKLLMRGLQHLQQLCKTDTTAHDLFLPLAGMWGYPAIFMRVAPNNHRQKSCSDLRMYMRAKTYQIQADRAYGLLFDTAGELQNFIYMTNPPAKDSDLDRLVGSMKLLSTD